MTENSGLTELCQRALDVADVAGVRASAESFRRAVVGDCLSAQGRWQLEAHRQTQEIIKSLTANSAAESLAGKVDFTHLFPSWRAQDWIGSAGDLSARLVGRESDRVVRDALARSDAKHWLDWFSRWRKRPEIQRVLAAMDRLGFTVLATTQYVEQVASLSDLSRLPATDGVALSLFKAQWSDEAPAWVTTRLLCELVNDRPSCRVVAPKKQTEAARQVREDARDAKLARIRSDHERGIQITARSYAADLAKEFEVTPAYIRALRNEYLRSK
ncbi:hypothetical protein [Paraburkholderia sacchari]|uniref:hypothetical protein n=1 Tax=Paraburkholderia sacchari TaxID=159450 RepID=UPI0005442578|nr:hypothetical protein [Paraburkholderia sacchari]NLP62309.1 hypothetical protein [Paraburkholderia sacchari]